MTASKQNACLCACLASFLPASLPLRLLFCLQPCICIYLFFMPATKCQPASLLTILPWCLPLSLLFCLPASLVHACQYAHLLPHQPASLPTSPQTTKSVMPPPCLSTSLIYTHSLLSVKRCYCASLSLSYLSLWIHFSVCWHALCISLSVSMYICIFFCTYMYMVPTSSFVHTFCERFLGLWLGICGGWILIQSFYNS